MRLAGQDSRADQRGYAMAALLVGMSVMAVMMAAALPVWSHAARREKEEELIWRGEQYKRAIMLFQRKYANTFPPNLDILVEQRFLRKKYKDPITGDDFQIIPVGGAMPGMPGIPGVPGAPGGPGNPSSRPQPGVPGGQGAGSFAAGGAGRAQAGSGGFGAAPGSVGSGFGQAAPAAAGFGQMTPGTQPAMGIQGVTSKSKDASIKLYNGLDHYNQWAFVYLAASTQAGAGGAGFARPGQGAGGVNQPGVTGNPRGGFGAPGGFGQPTMPPVPGGGFGQPGQPPFGQPGQSPFGQPGQSPFGQPGQSPFGQPGQGGFGQPFGQPSGTTPSPGGIFTPSAPGAPGQVRRPPDR